MFIEQITFSSNSNQSTQINRTEHMTGWLADWLACGSSLHRNVQEPLQDPGRQEVQRDRGIREVEWIEKLTLAGSAALHDSAAHHSWVLPIDARDAGLDGGRALCVGGPDGADGDADGAALVEGELHAQGVEESAQGVFAGGVQGRVGHTHVT